MVNLRELLCCARRLHPDLQSRVKPDTLKRYKSALDSFVNYAQLRQHVSLETPEDLDLLVMEYRTENDLSKSNHSLLLAALEFFMPNLKGKLVITKEAVKGRQNSEPIRHTIPLPNNIAHLFAAHFASSGNARLGAAILAQLGTGLRPSELLGIRKEHAHVPLRSSEPVCVALAIEFSTKIKREQFVQIDFEEDPSVHRLFCLVFGATDENQFLFPFSYHIYNKAFSSAEEHFGLALGLTAHSGRAGFATGKIMQNCDPKRVQRQGRWISESSFNTYIDVMGCLHAQAQIASGELAHSARWCQEHIWAYIREDTLDAKQQSAGFSRTNARLSLQREPRLVGAGARRPVSTSASSVERTTIHHPDDSANQNHNLREQAFEAAQRQLDRSRNSGSNTTLKGRGRGQLVRRR